MAATLGDNIILLVNSSEEEDQYVFAATRAHIITTECETIEVCSPSQGKWREYIAGRKKWKIKTSWLLVNQGFKSQMLQIGNIYTIAIGSRTLVNDHVTGRVMITQASVKATKGNLVQGNFELTGIGALT